ncbi:unnamed protein product [Closterium sp. NIES-53]
MWRHCFPTRAWTPDPPLHLCITASLHHCISASLHLCITASLHHCITASLHHLTIISTRPVLHLSHSAVALPSTNQWGLLRVHVLSRMCSQPIIVYIPESKARQGARWGGGVVPIAEYGSEFGRAAGAHGNKARKAVRLLYNGTNHYDLLL